MTSWADDSDSEGTVTPAAGSPGPSLATQAEPGWYPDPWAGDHHRYWDGTAWTGHAFPNGPTPTNRYESGPAAMAAPAATWGIQDSTQTIGATDWSAPPTQTDWRPAPDATSQYPTTEYPTPQYPTTQYPTTDWSAPGGPSDWRYAPAGPSGSGPWSPPTKSGWPPTGRRLVVLLVLLVLVVGSGSMGITYLALRKPAKPLAETTLPTTPANPTPTTPANPTPSTPSSPSTPSGPSNPGVTPTSPNAPAAPTDPLSTALAQMVVNQGDVPAAVSVQALVGGDQVSGQTTLDLCDGTYPSESLRSVRLQVAVVDTQDNTPISTEAVAYKNPAATVQGFSELKAAAASCPSTPVVSPVGEPTVATKFAAAPDGSWPQVAGVDRLAYDFVTTDATGQTHHSVAVYLRRGRFLMGIYFSQPDSTQIAVNGQTAIPGIVNIFALRLAAQPDALANGSG